MTKLLERFAGMSVLIVDDNEDNVSLLRAVIASEGLERTYTETDSRKVLERLAELHPDLILLDLHMPDVDGFELLGDIKRLAGGDYLPVIVLTADITTNARNQALTFGAQDFLTKPFDIVEVILRIANLLDTKRLYSSLRSNESNHRSMETTEREVVTSRITDVLRDESITQVFQAVVETESLRVIGYEGLSRFPTPNFGGPDRWFADAFEVGKGVELEWMAASKMLPFLDSAPPETFLALNMSPATILYLFEAELCHPELWPRIVIEVTEHVPIEDYSTVKRALESMRDHGTRLAADDVGSGYAGFRHLVSLRPDIIKLDISLVSGINENDGQRALAGALIAFANDIGATIIAEGVERRDELTTLRELGVPWAQGYYLGHPSAVA